MQFLPAPLTRVQSDTMIDRMQALSDEKGWGVWCLEVDGRCVGCTGLSRPVIAARFTACVEIG